MFVSRMGSLEIVVQLYTSNVEITNVTMQEARYCHPVDI